MIDANGDATNTHQTQTITNITLFFNET